MMDINAQIAQRLQPVAPVSGPQYSGAGPGPGPVNPVVPAGYTQVGNRMLSPSVMATQAAQQAAQGVAPGLDSNAAAAQNYQNILNDMAASRQQAQLGADEARRRQQLSNDPGITTEMNKIQSMPDGVKKYAMLNNYKNQLSQQYPGVFLPTGRTNEQVARAQWDQGSGVRNAEYMEARRLAEEKYYRDRNAAMAKAQSGPGFSLGNLAQAFNPFKGVTRIAEGQGRPQDYLKIASMFL